MHVCVCVCVHVCVIIVFREHDDIGTGIRKK